MADDAGDCLAGELQDLRRDERWREGRLATLRAQGGEWPALTRELSLGGARLGVYGVGPMVGDSVTVEIAFEGATVRLQGTVRHATKTTWGSVVGVEFQESAHSYLARRGLARQGPPRTGGMRPPGLRNRGGGEKS